MVRVEVHVLQCLSHRVLRLVGRAEGVRQGREVEDFPGREVPRFGVVVEIHPIIG